MGNIKFLKNNFIKVNGVLYTPYLIGDFIIMKKSKTVIASGLISKV
jgi:hypothetical protein